MGHRRVPGKRGVVDIPGGDAGGQDRFVDQMIDGPDDEVVEFF